VAHVSTVLGMREAGMEAAWITAMAQPTQGYVPFLTVLRPGLAVQPPTLFINKAPMQGEYHERLTWGAAQAGVASGVTDAVAEGTIAAGLVRHLLLIASVWVDPEALDPEAIFGNNRLAALLALRSGAQGGPAIEELLAARDRPSNSYFHPDR